MHSLNYALLNNEKLSYKWSLGIVLICYGIIYYLFLYKNQFLPYVFDNNETFSSLIHAQNLFHFGLKSTFGLTDEAYGLLNSAHPYVYTHQGNFPRFFSLLLYCIGVKSPEGQLLITTFTIGALGFCLCYHYFAKHVSHLFAVIFCLLLMTDYLMFAQWHVNTWRVWHLFFFFSSFLCCHALQRERNNVSIIISILNFSCLFYTEIAYASFVFFSAGIYLFFLQGGSLKRKIFNVGILSVGAIFGAAVLIAQNIAYLGFDRFFQDLIYTFSARNQLLDSVKANKVIDFYATNKIVFWDNFNTLEKIRNPLLIIKNFYRYCILPYSPFISLCALLAMLGTVVASLSILFKQNIKKYGSMVSSKPKYLFFMFFLCCIYGIILFVFFPSTWDHRFPHVFPLGTVFILTLIALLLEYFNQEFKINSIILNYLPKLNFHKIKLLLVVSLLLNVLFLPSIMFSSFVASHFLYRFSMALVVCIILAYAVLASTNFLLEKYGKISAFSGFIDIKFFVGILVTICFLICLIFLFFSSIPINIDRSSMARYFESYSTILLLLLLTILFFYLVNTDLNKKTEKEILSMKIIIGVFYFLLTIMLSYIMYYLDRYAGSMAIYIQQYTLSVLRHSSFVLFIIGLLLILSNPFFYFYSLSLDNYEIRIFKKILPFIISVGIGGVVAYLIFPGYVRTGYWLRYCCFTVFAHMVFYAWLFFLLIASFFDVLRFKTCEMTRYIRAGIGLLLALLFGYLWINLQYFYMQTFPADNFNFIKLLRQPRFHKHPIVVNTYAAPFAYVGQTWAYFDPSIAWSKVDANHEMNRLQNDRRYLWFADFKTNPRYQHQAYFICWQNIYSLEFLGQPKPVCADLPLIRFIRNHPNNTLGLNEIAHDRSGRDTWSIVSLIGTDRKMIKPAATKKLKRSGSINKK